MTSERVISTIISEMIDRNILTTEMSGLALDYMNMVYVTGFEAGSKSRSNKKPVVQYDMNMNKISDYESAAQASRVTGIQHSDINKCCLGKLHSAGKYIWRYYSLESF